MSGSSIAKRAAIGREAPTRDIASPSAEHCQGPVVSGREQLAQRDCQLPTWSGCACVQAGWHSFRFPAASLAVLASSVAGQLRRELHDRLDRSTKGATSRRQPAGASSRRAAGPDTSARTHENHRAQGHDDLYQSYPQPAILYLQRCSFHTREGMSPYRWRDNARTSAHHVSCPSRSASTRLPPWPPQTPKRHRRLAKARGKKTQS